MMQHLALFIHENRDPPSHQRASEDAASRLRVIADHDDIAVPVAFFAHQLQYICRRALRLRIHVRSRDERDRKSAVLRFICRLCAHLSPVCDRPAPMLQLRDSRPYRLSLRSMYLIKADGDTTALRKLPELPHHVTG